MCKKVATATTTPQLMRMYAYKWCYPKTVLTQDHFYGTFFSTCYTNYFQALPPFCLSSLWKSSRSWQKGQYAGS